MGTFSERNGYEVPDAEISVRHEAPDWLRSILVDFAYQAGLEPSDLRVELCALLFESPDQSNWSEFPNIDGEVRQLLASAEWFLVYDFIEILFERLSAKPSCGDENSADKFAELVNRAFRKKGIGWQLVDGKIQIRGPEVFEEYVRRAVSLADESTRGVARTELHEALRDLSRRPNPEITGAIQHAMAALECVAKDVTGHPSVTLGEWVKKNPNHFPQPLGTAIEKLWGYTSQYGRHVLEGKPADFDEAELVVGLAGALCVYLLRKA